MKRRDLDERHHTSTSKNAWSISKATNNARDHGVKFEDAELALCDINRKECSDTIHSRGANRFTILGMANGSLLRVTVEYIYEDNGRDEGSYFIVTARKADNSATDVYYNVPTGTDADIGIKQRRTTAKRMNGRSMEKKKRNIKT